MTKSIRYFRSSNTVFFNFFFSHVIQVVINQLPHQSDRMEPTTNPNKAHLQHTTTFNNHLLLPPYSQQNQQYRLTLPFNSNKILILFSMHLPLAQPTFHPFNYNNNRLLYCRIIKNLFSPQVIFLLIFLHHQQITT